MTIEIGSWLEEDLLPSPDVLNWNSGKVEQIQLTLIDKVQHYVTNFFKFVVHVLFAIPIVCVNLWQRMGRCAVSFVLGKKEEEWNPPTGPVIDRAAAVPNHFGFATSMFQDSGLGTEFTATPLPGKGVCDWNEWLNPQRIEGSDENYRKFFFDILRSPVQYVEILKSQNVNAHRFSLEWAVVEPEPGRYDQEAIGLLRNFINTLKQNGIEPYVTLHHFVCPKWFKDSGGFDNIENIEIFKTHALNMMELFPEVKYWMPFNEINVDGFQKCVRGVYPPGEVGNISGAGRMMRNMLVSHCLIYKEAKEKWSDKMIGSSHQWLKFEPLEGNLLEEAVCYFLSKITHYACYDFFRTGKFSLEVPGVANVQLSIPREEFEKNNGFSDFQGVQFYGLPRLKLGFNGGEEYPGFGITNLTIPALGIGLTFGATCKKGGMVQSFGPGFYPESLDKCLQEAIEIVKPFPGKSLVISETGCDANIWKFGERTWSIDYEVQKIYFEKILPIVLHYIQYISALFVWTLAKNLEWERGDTPILNVGEIFEDEEGKIRKNQPYQPYPAADHLKDLYQEKMQEMQRAIPAIPAA